MHQAQKPYMTARPAGESDEFGSSSDDEDFDMSGFSSRNRKRNVITRKNGIPPSSDSQTLHDEEDWGAEEAESSAPTMDWGGKPTEEIRLCCMRGNLDRLTIVFEKAEKDGFKINNFLDDNTTPLNTAARYCRPDIIEWLLKKGANVNIYHHKDKTTALIAAVSSVERHSESIESTVVQCVKLLVEAKADINRQDQFGISALGQSIKRKRHGILQYLLDNGADPNLEDSNGRTCLFYAAEMGEGRMSRTLLEKGADVNAVDYQGWTAVELANDKGFYRLGELLHTVRDTKWKPGLHPKLMLEIDEEAAAKRESSNSAESLGVREDSQLDMLLTSLQAGKYIDLFRKHKISYLQFIRLEDEHLKEIGIEELGIRTKICDAIHEIHNIEWAKTSLKMVPFNKKLTAAESVCMLNNMKNHLQYLSTTLKYMKSRISKDPLGLQYGKERNKIQDIISLCIEMGQSNVLVEQEGLELLQVLKGIEGNAEFKLADEVKPIKVEDFISRWNRKNNSQKGSWKYKGILGVTVGIIFATGIFHHRSAFLQK